MQEAADLNTYKVHDKVQSMIFPVLAAPAYLHQQCTGRHRWKGYVIKSTNEEYKESMCSKYNTKIWDSKCLHWCEDIAWIPVPASPCPRVSQPGVSGLARPRHGQLPHTRASTAPLSAVCCLDTRTSEDCNTHYHHHYKVCMEINCQYKNEQPSKGKRKSSFFFI